MRSTMKRKKIYLEVSSQSQTEKKEGVTKNTYYEGKKKEAQAGSEERYAGVRRNTVCPK